MIYRLGDRVPQFDGEHWVAPNATVIGSVRCAPGVGIWFNCVLRGDNDDITIGANTNIQEGSVLHTDPGIKLTIGADCTIGHMVMLHGCEIGDNTLIGIGSVVLNRAKIGRNCIVGANALITEGKEFPDNSLIVGSPAKVVRTLDESSAAMLKMQALHYVQNARRFREQLQPV
ncbi:gamma carbonic anhydrase family protein [Solimonas terrae]|uniref:Gamma carbonic anhydrase family protein n=1 Tax=Solimonas terrae TaxID=1396819 RepID=A0A6M2BNZ6_9GAMM|nr:gamma carbonic anhydrase family protein [Solimonas terrae]NGY04198.1 gamma carbonic anhydrase family protein [Solimonas terrae]